MTALVLILIAWLSVPVAATAYFAYVDYFAPHVADYEKLPPLLAFLLALGWPAYLLAAGCWMGFSMLCSLIYRGDR
jgi:hypothetical protein